MSTSLGRFGLATVLWVLWHHRPLKAPQIAETDEAKSIIKQEARGDGVKKRQKVETTQTQREKRRKRGRTAGNKADGVEGGVLPVDRGQRESSWLAKPHPSSCKSKREGEGGVGGGTEGQIQNVEISSCQTAAQREWRNSAWQPPINLHTAKFTLKLIKLYLLLWTGKYLLTKCAKANYITAPLINKTTQVAAACKYFPWLCIKYWLAVSDEQGSLQTQNWWAHINYRNASVA